MTNIYNQYKELNRQYKALELTLEDLKQVIMADMKEQSLTKNEGFTLCSKKKYTYSPAVTDLADNLKIKKIEEEEQGIAEVSYTEYITYKETLNQ